MGRTLPCLRSPGWICLLTTAAALCFWGAEGKVYYSCGAQFTSMERGLILSPGFPNNYSSGMHCIWQFFIPAGTHLMLEIFDFDIFESLRDNPSAWDGFLSLPKNANRVLSPTEGTLEHSSSLPSASATLQNSHPRGLYNLHETFPEVTSANYEFNQSQQKQEPKEFAVSQPSELPYVTVPNATVAKHHIDGRKENKESKDNTLLAHLTAREIKKGAEGYSQHFEGTSLGEDATISTTALPTGTSATPASSEDLCPHDVLYVSDLVTFSSRFCGANSPLDQHMTFGSSLKMVEVIVELITTTDRGRGFAMLFEYQNDTVRTATEDAKEWKENVMMLVIITGIVFFALVLLSSLCITFRQKLCPKRSSLDVHCDQENGIQNAAVDLNELQLVMPSQGNENNNHSLGGNRPVTPFDGTIECSSPPIDPDVPSSVSAGMTESGSDEVFIISASPGAGGLSFTSYRIQDKNLKRSVTSPASVSDWLATEQAGSRVAAMEKGAVQAESRCPAQQTWCSRAFLELLAPFPQLQKKWCSWTTNSPSAKQASSSGLPPPTRDQTTLPRKVTSAVNIEGVSEPAYSDSSASTASYPLTHSAQKQRKLSGGCNLKKSRFRNPYFGFVTSSPDSNQPRRCDPSEQVCVRSPGSDPSQGLKPPLGDPLLSLVNGSKTKELLLEIDKPKPVFVISEESDDQQPLVWAEHVNQCTEVGSAPSIIIHNPGMVTTNENPAGTTVQGNSLAEPPGTRADLDLWGENPNLHRDSLEDCHSYTNQSNSSGPDSGCTRALAHFESLAAHRLCQSSVQ